MDDRRRDYPEILERLANIEKKVNGGLADQFADLKQTQRLIWDKHDIEAKEFRNKTEKIWMEVLSRLDKLPCESRKENNAIIWNNIYALWATVGIVFVALLTKFFTGGG